MKNYERYADEIKNFDNRKDFCSGFVLPCILKSSECSGIGCRKCQMKQMIWLLEEYEEPEVDWSKVEVDTPILVKDTEYENWRRRYFAKYEDGAVFAWVGGNTSWTSKGAITEWKYAKLAESEKDKR